jgi:hypothetical protein
LPECSFRLSEITLVSSRNISRIQPV